MTKVIVIAGTRPEAIKLAPVVRKLENREDVTSIFCVTGQHREMLDQVLDLFQIEPQYDLDVMKASQSPSQVASTIFSRLEPILERERPDWVLVQGDTTTVMAASVCAFYNRIRVGHVEAGLRTNDKWQPFPEEINRRVAGVVADRHFAPTQTSRNNLVRENVRPDSILVTGNTVIDALHWVVKQPLPATTLKWLQRHGIRLDPPSPVRRILLTAHRRESHGAPLEEVFLAVRDIAREYGSSVEIVYPVHLNPRVREHAQQILGRESNIVLIPPLEYLSLVSLMKGCYLVLTDSGGLQEEAPGLGKPVLVLRDTTERPEGVEAGTVQLVGTNRARIVEETRRLLEDTDFYKKMAMAVNPYGDGRAAERIVNSLVSDQSEAFAAATG